MQKKKKEFLTLTSQYSGNYDLWLAYGESFNPKEVSIPDKKAFKHDVCFAAYLDKYSGKEEEKEYHPLFVDLPKTLNGCGATSCIDKLRKEVPEIDDVFEAYKSHLFEELSKYVDISLQEDIICFIPRRKYNYLQMLLLVTKLRTLFEPSYLWAALGSMFLKEDFPTLILDQIYYLLIVFIYRGGGVHGVYNPRFYGNKQNAYQDFDKLVEMAADSRKYTNINLNSGSTLLKTKIVSFDISDLDVLKKYDNLVKNHKQILL